MESVICTEGTSSPVCPFCGRRDVDWWDGIGESLKFDGDEAEMECPSCEKSYTVTIHRDIRFDTNPTPSSGAGEVSP